MGTPGKREFVQVPRLPEVSRTDDVLCRIERRRRRPQSLSLPTAGDRNDHLARGPEARDDKRPRRLQRQLAGHQLLIIDELGYVPLSPTRALLDRLTHHMHILEMNGDSFTLQQSKRRVKEDQPTPPPE